MLVAPSILLKFVRITSLKPSSFQVCFQSGSTPKISTSQLHRPTEREKRSLIAMGKYKTVEEIPEYVSYDSLYKAKDKSRIRAANWMMLATVLGCIYMVYAGKKEAAAGRSWEGDNQAWHRQFEQQQPKSDQ